MWTEIEFKENLDMKEIQKALCFVSEDILSVELSGNKVKLEVLDECDLDRIIVKIKNMSKQYKVYRSNALTTKINYKSGYQYYPDILENNEMFGFFDNGLLYLKGKAIFLFNFFEERFCNLADELGAIQKLYPVLLPIKDYVKTGYINRSPQYAIFCANVHENMDELERLPSAIGEDKVKGLLREPRFALSPSACFHVYLEYKGKVLQDKQIISFTQNVFRNEGRLNYYEPGRLMDYHVREIVFLGDEEYVQSKRIEALEKAKELLNKWGLQACIQNAADPFVLPKMQKYRKIQLIDSSKYEVCLRMSENEDLAVASFNFHGTAFTHPFQIGIEGCKEPITGCVGFGIERWVVAFLTQFGSDEKNWPEEFRKEYYASIGEKNSD